MPKATTPLPVRDVRRRLPYLALLSFAAVALVLCWPAARRWVGRPWRSLPPGWTEADLWQEFDLVLDDGTAVAEGQVLPASTRLRLVRSPRPGQAAPTEPASAAAAPESFELAAKGDFDVRSLIFSVEDEGWSSRGWDSGWTITGLAEGSAVRLHAEGPYELTLASHGDRRISSAPLRIVVGPRETPQPDG